MEGKQVIDSGNESNSPKRKKRKPGNLPNKLSKRKKLIDQREDLND